MNDTDKYKLHQPEIEAVIYYLTEEEGGRRMAVRDGYRGQFYYNGKDWDAPQQFVDKEICNPGETVKVFLKTLSPDFHVGQFSVGQEFETREGAKTVGKGKITKILRSDFNYWDGATFLKSLDKNIKPYSEIDVLLNVRIDFESWLKETEIIDDIQFEMTDNLQCMLLVKCKLINKNLQPREVANKIITCWKKGFSTSNHLYKIQMDTRYDININQSNLEKFVLKFATWNSNFLTGQVIVTK